MYTSMLSTIANANLFGVAHLEIDAVCASLRAML
jgi:hypothetical protein